MTARAAAHLLWVPTARVDALVRAGLVRAERIGGRGSFVCLEAIETALAEENAGGSPG